MKKLKLLVMPLMAIPFLVSCANAGGGGGDDPKQKEWYEDTTYLNALTEADVTKDNGDGTIGVVRTLKVNGLDHKVRLIGVDKDVDSEGNTIHTTWEFVNLISDEHGHSLATQWNDTNDVNKDTGSANFNYLDSSVRMALVGEKQELGHILWAQKGAEAWSRDSSYQKKCVLDMIEKNNPGFKSVLKSPSKFINIYNTTTTQYEEKTVNDKLFLLSPFEMGRTVHDDEEEHTSVYSYYENARENADRIKKQVDSEEAYFPDHGPKINYVLGSGQVYQNKVTNYAGYNFKSADFEGGDYYWLRSPYKKDRRYAWHIYPNGMFYSDQNTVYDCAYAVAPAFCI